MPLAWECSVDRERAFALGLDFGDDCTALV